EQHTALLTEAREYLSGVTRRLKAHGFNVEPVVRLGEAAVEIAAAADEYAAAAVVMATHGRTGFARALIGSVAGQVVRRSGVPVMLVRPRSLRAAEEPVATQTGWHETTPAGVALSQSGLD